MIAHAPHGGQRAGVPGGRNRRRSACSGSGPTLRASDLDLVRWLAEQYAARVDHLEALTGRGPRTVQRVLARLREAQLLSTRRMLVGEPAWVIPTPAGLRACGSPFGAWQPRIGLLAHAAAVNSVRLHVEARSPGCEWICERGLARERSPKDHLPDGVVLLDGRSLAIEVELTVKGARRIEAIVGELCVRHDAVVYFCAPAPYRRLSELATPGRWPKLEVRRLPERGQS